MTFLFKKKKKLLKLDIGFKRSFKVYSNNSSKNNNSFLKKHTFFIKNKKNIKKSQKDFFVKKNVEKNALTFVNTKDNLERFWNFSFDKGRLKNFVSWFLKTYGQKKTVELLEQLKELGFNYATKAGISLGIEDLRIPPQKRDLIYQAESHNYQGLIQYNRGEITGVERFQRLIDTWHQTSESLKQEVIRHFEATDIFNPVYMMAFSGARGNISQVRQLVGMRGLMADPQGRIIDFSIRSNFREGLTLTEYIISSYGARKGIVDTALRTANAGYLTRRLVDVAQHVIVSQFDCGTQRGIYVFEMKEGAKTIYSFQNRLIGRVLAENIVSGDHMIALKDQEISSDLAKSIAKVTKKALIRSPLTCETRKLVCQLCYGWSLSHGHLVSIGEAVGIIAAQSIGEPGTQLTMRTFHTGGVFSGGFTEQIIAQYDGIVEYSSPIPGICIRTPQGEIAFLTKGEGSLIFNKEKTLETTTSNQNGTKLNGLQTGTLVSESKSFAEIYKIPAYSVLFARNKQRVLKKQTIAQISSFSTQKAQRGDAEQTIFSEFEGQLYQSNIDIIEKINEYEDLSLEAWNWGYIWILAGKIYQFPVESNFFPHSGDLIKKNSILNKISWSVPETCFLHTQKTQSMKSNFTDDILIKQNLQTNFYQKASLKTNLTKTKFITTVLSESYNNDKYKSILLSQNQFSLIRQKQNKRLYKQINPSIFSDTSRKKQSFLTKKSKIHSISCIDHFVKNKNFRTYKNTPHIISNIKIPQFFLNKQVKTRKQKSSKLISKFSKTNVLDRSPLHAKFKKQNLTSYSNNILFGFIFRKYKIKKVQLFKNLLRIKRLKKLISRFEQNYNFGVKKSSDKHIKHLNKYLNKKVHSNFSTISYIQVDRCKNKFFNKTKLLSYPKLSNLSLSVILQNSNRYKMFIFSKQRTTQNLVQFVKLRRYKSKFINDFRLFHFKKNFFNEFYFLKQAKIRSLNLINKNYGYLTSDLHSKAINFDKYKLLLLRNYYSYPIHDFSYKQKNKLNKFIKKLFVSRKSCFSIPKTIYKKVLKRKVVINEKRFSNNFKNINLKKHIDFNSFETNSPNIVSVQFSEKFKDNKTNSFFKQKKAELLSFTKLEYSDRKNKATQLTYKSLYLKNSYKQTNLTMNSIIFNKLQNLFLKKNILSLNLNKISYKNVGYFLSIPALQNTLTSSTQLSQKKIAYDNIFVSVPLKQNPDFSKNNVSNTNKTTNSDILTLNNTYEWGPTTKLFLKWYPKEYQTNTSGVFTFYNLSEEKLNNLMQLKLSFLKDTYPSLLKLEQKEIFFSTSKIEKNRINFKNNHFLKLTFQPKGLLTSKSVSVNCDRKKVNIVNQKSNAKLHIFKLKRDFFDMTNNFTETTISDKDPLTQSPKQVSEQFFVSESFNFCPSKIFDQKFISREKKNFIGNNNSILLKKREFSNKVFCFKITKVINSTNFTKDFNKYSKEPLTKELEFYFLKTNLKLEIPVVNLTLRISNKFVLNQGPEILSYNSFKNSKKNSSILFSSVSFLQRKKLNLLKFYSSEPSFSVFSSSVELENRLYWRSSLNNIILKNNDTKNKASYKKKHLLTKNLIQKEDRKLNLLKANFVNNNLEFKTSDSRQVLKYYFLKNKYVTQFNYKKENSFSLNNFIKNEFWWLPQENYKISTWKKNNILFSKYFYIKKHSFNQLDINHKNSEISPNVKSIHKRLKINLTLHISNKFVLNQGLESNISDNNLIIKDNNNKWLSNKLYKNSVPLSNIVENKNPKIKNLSNKLPTKKILFLQTNRQGVKKVVYPKLEGILKITTKKLYSCKGNRKLQSNVLDQNFSSQLQISKRKTSLKNNSSKSSIYQSRFYNLSSKYLANKKSFFQKKVSLKRNFYNKNYFISKQLRAIVALKMFSTLKNLKTNYRNQPLDFKNRKNSFSNTKVELKSFLKTVILQNQQEYLSFLNLVSKNNSNKVKPIKVSIKNTYNLSKKNQFDLDKKSNKISSKKEFIPVFENLLKLKILKTFKTKLQPKAKTSFFKKQFLAKFHKQNYLVNNCVIVKKQKLLKKYNKDLLNPIFSSIKKSKMNCFVKTEKYNMTIQQGWVYVPKNKQNDSKNYLNKKIFNYHKTFINIGKQFMDDLCFDKQKIYTEIIPETILSGSVLNSFQKPAYFYLEKNNLNLNCRFMKFDKFKSSNVFSNLVCDLDNIDFKLKNSSKLFVLIQQMEHKSLPSLNDLKNQLYIKQKKDLQPGFSLQIYYSYHSNFLNKQVTTKNVISSFAGSDLKISSEFQFANTNFQTLDLKQIVSNNKSKLIDEKDLYFSSKQKNCRNNDKIYLSKKPVQFYPLLIECLYPSNFHYPFKLPSLNFNSKNSPLNVDILRSFNKVNVEFLPRKFTLNLPCLNFASSQKMAYLANQRLFANYFLNKDLKSLSNYTLTLTQFDRVIKSKNYLQINRYKSESQFRTTSTISPLSLSECFTSFPLSMNEFVLNSEKFILSNKTFAKTSFFSPLEGEILSDTLNAWSNSSNKNRRLILTINDLFSYFLPKTNVLSQGPEIRNSSSKPETHISAKRPEIKNSSRKPSTNSRRQNTLIIKDNSNKFTTSQLLDKNISTNEKINSIPESFIKYKNKIYKIKGLKVGFLPHIRKLHLGSFFIYGDLISPNIGVDRAGQIIHVSQSKITLRRAQPIFVSPKGILHMYNGDYIAQNAPVTTLPFQTLKTGDIVQGIPKVEQYFEARTTKRGRLFRDSLPNLLQGLFESYQSVLPQEQAVRQSILKIQQILVDGVQRVYRSQGVSIADKHLEIVVRQMTSKVQIVNGGQTGFFPGELVDIEFVEHVNNFLMKKIHYEPIVLGITRASLEVESFLSAASFQQTTKVLSRAAIYGKRDFLRGLKENIMVGNLIPAGTGFLTYVNDLEKRFDFS